MDAPNDKYPLLNGRPLSAVDVGQSQHAFVRVTAVPGTDDRKWDLSCANCCGLCDGVGWAVCCLTTWCFPCTFGYVKYRAFGDFKKALAWAALFTVLLYAPRIYYSIFFEQQKDNEKDISDDRKLVAQRNGTFSVEFGETPDHDGHGAVGSRLFGDAEPVIFVVFWLLVAVCIIGVTIAGLCNRMQMRRKFRITPAGRCCECAPEVEDACLWIFCKPCATCQEARTLIVNRVDDGVWLGPLPTVTVHAAAAGVPASGVPSVPFTHAVARLSRASTPTSNVAPNWRPEAMPFCYGWPSSHEIWGSAGLKCPVNLARSYTCSSGISREESVLVWGFGFNPIVVWMSYSFVRPLRWAATRTVTTLPLF
eukprot:evm.model.scf_1045.2 EVM.evm.TU.scf_1045.2   scf_1045:8723-10377(-)